MVNLEITERLCAFRKVMKEIGVDFYMVPSSDFHNSEYVDAYFKVRQYLCGFSGSSGVLVISDTEAGLWTDGRYFIQAEKELEGTGVTLYRTGEEGVPDKETWICDRIQNGQVLGFDGRVVDTYTGKLLEELLQEKGCGLKYEQDLADQIWKNRPNLPCHPVMVLDEAICGETAGSKIAAVREKMKELKADAFFLSRLDDLMWLTNVRGKDIPCNPVAFSYAYVTATEFHFFMQSQAVTEALKKHTAKYGIILHDYAEITDYLKEHARGKVLCEVGNTSYAMYKIISENAAVLEGSNPTVHLKACKNDTEISMMRKVYAEDSAAVCKFIYWLKKNVGKIKITERSAAAKIDAFRARIDSYLDLSFPTISAYKEDAAMMHYAATPDHDLEIMPEGMFLVDSGGQYLGGTTDVTRTIVVGKITDEMKMHFTAVAMGMLALSDARFLYGCTGRNLDILARGPLWERGLDYRCGTGHGIGYILNVHEGPQGLRWKFAEGTKEAVLEEGMILTVEPGVYVEGSHGIRTENVLVVTKGEKNEYGQFMYLENLTWVPIDLDAIDVSMMSAFDIARLNAYHEKVREVITPYLNTEEAEWLTEATKAV